ncbi:MAG: glycosyltransferase family 2 protein [Phascolarctobacterium sp.]|nr:glycosyltransferase family 2 protein [Phascolarctobacterium sp.]
MAKLTVIVLTKNEEQNIVDVVKNSKQVTDDVLIIDSGSTDKTCELAEKYGARVVFRAWDNDFSAQRNFGLTQTDADWVLYLDADERLNDELVADVKLQVQKNTDKQYSFKRKSVAFGQEFNYGVLRPDKVARMFKRERVHWVNKVHERPECKDAIVQLKGFVRHYTYTSWEQYFTKFNHYTTIWAENAYEQGKTISPIGICLRMFFGFIKMLILKGGILDGWLGIVLSFIHVFYTMTKYVKLQALHNSANK